MDTMGNMVLKERPKGRPMCDVHPRRPCSKCGGTCWRNKTTPCNCFGGSRPNYTDRKPCIFCHQEKEVALDRINNPAAYR